MIIKISDIKRIYNKNQDKKMMNHKDLLIVERSSGVLKVSDESQKDYVLEGVFGEIDSKNKNNRIYTEDEYVPQIEALQQKIKSSKLLGELDHPTQFDTSLKNVSHIIEDLYYDKDSKQVRGKIRLLDTDAGRQAKALVDAGVPLQISSRAAGTVESNGKVKIKQLFTYDLVADPGFENAELKRVNESYGFSNDHNLFIYEIGGSSEIENTQQNISESKMEEFVKAGDFNKYTEYLAEQIKSLKEAIKTSTGSAANQDEISKLNESIKNIIAHNDHIVESVNNLSEYAQYLAENLDNAIGYTEHIAEKTDQGIQYSEHLAEKLDQVIDYTEYVAEKADQGIQYSESLAEKLDQGIQYSEHLAEKLDQGIQYSEHLAERLDQSIQYSEHVAEKTDQGIQYAEHLAESLVGLKDYANYLAEAHNSNSFEAEKLIEYTNYLKDNLQNVTEYAQYIAESINEGLSLNEAEPGIEAKDLEDETHTADYQIPPTGKIDPADKEMPEDEGEDGVVDPLESYKRSISAKLNRLVESAEAQINENPAFFKVVSSEIQNKYNQLNEAAKTEVRRAVSKRGFMTEAQIESLIENSTRVVEQRAAEPFFIQKMPSEYKETWQNLSESKKSQIIAQSNYHRLETEYQVRNFWQTRDFRESKPVVDQLQAINEKKQIKPAYDVSSYADALKKRFNK